MQRNAGLSFINAASDQECISGHQDFYHYRNATQHLSAWLEIISIQKRMMPAQRAMMIWYWLQHG
jgi:hypothetical protein